MSNPIHQEYHRLRSIGWRGSDALRATRVNVAFSEAEERGDVQFCVVIDCEPYDASYIDTWTDVSSQERDQARRATATRCDDEGVFGIRALARMSCGELHDVDDVWGFIGDDWQDSGYDIDLRATALATLTETQC